MASKKDKSIRKKRNIISPPLHPSDQWISIGSGNYKGNWNHRTMSGNGVYVMFDGTVYKGYFDNGLYHGAGTMYFPSGCRIEGVWENGKCVERSYISNDGLRFQPDNWQYCVTPDRRFAVEHINGFEPASTNRITNGPLIEIPNEAYDTGEGLYQPFTNTVHDYWTNALLKVPTAEGARWIMENCRRGGDDEMTDCRPELNENGYFTRENVCFDIDDEPFKQNMVNNDQPIIADVKSVPSSVYDLPLTDSHLSALSVSGRARQKNVIYPDFPDSLYQDAPSNRYGKDETSSERTTRQTNNRRPLNGGPQTFPSNEEEDPFDGLDTPVNQPSNNRPSGQWANNGNNNQWPNQQQASRPQNQNQRPNNGNQRPNQQQNFGGGGRPQGQNQWSNNGGNQGQGQNQWSNNGGNQGQGQNQWSNNGGSQGQGNNRPTNQNQNQQQTSPTSNSEITEEQRNVCNTNCRERNTNEYNPVCGSDSLTYQNRRFLTCVANCGIPTEFSYIGTCVTTTEGSVRK